MARGTYFGEDISIFLTEQEIVQIGKLEFDWNAPKGKKLYFKSLDVLLERENNSTITARIQFEEFDDSADGIKVTITDYGFLVLINDVAYWRMRDNPLSGTRYDGENKIHFHREE